jgi:hypothetical protein
MARPITALTDSFKILRDNLNTISNNVGDPDLLTTTSRALTEGNTNVAQRSDSSDVVSALNELDSDLHGAGGGDVKNDLKYVSYAINTVRDSGMTGAINAIDAFIGGDSDTLHVEANTIKDAINEIEAVFDASTKKINTAPDFTFDGGGDLEINVDGGNVFFKSDSNQYLDLTLADSTAVALTFIQAARIETADSATGHLTFDVGGKIVLDAEENVVSFKNGSFADEVVHTLANDATFEIDAPSTYTVDAVGDIILDADTGRVRIKDNGTEAYNFQSNGIVTSANALFVNASDFTLNTDSAGVATISFTTDSANRIVYTLTPSNQTMAVTNDLTIDASRDIILDAAGADIDMQVSGTSRIKHTMGDSNTVAVTGHYTLDASQDIILDADGGNWYLRDNGVTDFHFNTSGEIIRTGTITLQANGNGVVVDAGGTSGVNTGITFQASGTDKVTYTFTGSLVGQGYTTNLLDSVEGYHITRVDGLKTDSAGGAYTNNATTATFNTVAGDFTVDASGDINLDADGGDVFLKDGGTTYGSLTATGSNLIVKSGTTTALTFSGANVTTGGTVTTGGNLIMGGTNINRTGVLTLDASGQINIDAGTGRVELKDNGHIYGSFRNPANKKQLDIYSGNLKAIALDSSGNATITGTVTQGTALNTVATTLGASINEVHDELDSASADLQTTKGRVQTLEDEMDSNEGIIGVSVPFNVGNSYGWNSTTSNRDAINELDSSVGVLSNLDTTTYQGNSRNNIVRALNAVAGDLQDLQDSAGTLDGRIGSLANLAAFFDSAGATSSIVNALNHMASRVVDIYDENGTLLNT